MKTTVIKVAVFVFAITALGGMSLAPRVYGGDAPAPVDTSWRDEVTSRDAHNRAYNQAYDAAEAKRMAELTGDDGKEESGGSCG